MMKVVGNSAHTQQHKQQSKHNRHHNDGDSGVVYQHNAGNHHTGNGFHYPQQLTMEDLLDDVLLIGGWHSIIIQIVHVNQSILHQR